jgi:hypothetical protein
MQSEGQRYDWEHLWIIQQQCQLTWLPLHPTWNKWAVQEDTFGRHVALTIGHLVPEMPTYLPAELSPLCVLYLQKIKLAFLSSPEL